MILCFIFLVGLLLRVVWLWRIPEVHFDEAGTGLMARDILRGQFPMFYWGENYGGTLESFLTAVPFALFDSSVVTLRLVPFGFSLLFLLLSYRLARDLYDERTARLAMLYAAIPPLILLHFGVTAKNSYTEIPVFGLLLQLLAIRWAAGAGRQARSAFVLGLVAGIAWWIHMLLVSYLLAVGAFVLLRRRWSRLPSEVGAALVGFSIGSLAFWVRTLTQPGEGAGLIRLASWQTALEALSQAVRRNLPALLGASVSWPDPASNHLVLLAVGLIYLPASVFFLYEVVRIPLVGRPGSASGLLSLTALTVILVDVGSVYGSGGGPKYLVPLYGVLPVLLAHYTIAVRRTLGLVPGALLVCVILAVHTQDGVRNLLNSFQPNYLEQLTRPPMGALIDFLRSHEISRVYAHYQLSLKLTFDTREEIVAADWYGFRNPDYLDEVARAQRVALVTHKSLGLPDPGTLEENLTALGGSFRKHEVEGFVVFYGFLPPSPSRPIPPGDWSGGGVSGVEGAARAFDRDGATWWGSGEPQRPGLAYELNLGGVHRLTGLSLHAGPFREGAPRGYRVEVSDDGQSWNEVARLRGVLAGLHWAGSHPRFDRSGRIRAGFPPVEARYVRVTQIGRDSYFWWSIGEMFLYEDGPALTARSRGQAALEEGERLERLAGWEFIGASPVALTAWRWRRGVDWDGALGAYERALRADPELEEAHHRLAVVLLRLEISPPGDPGRAAALERIGAWRTAAREYEAALSDSPASRHRSSGWEARLRVARQAREPERAREIEAVLRTRFAPPIPTGVTFGRQLTLLGVGVEPARAVAGEEVRLTAYWQALRPVAEDYDAVVAFRSPSAVRFEAELLRVGGQVPPGEWLPGETVRDDLIVRVPPGIVPGDYEIHLRVRGTHSGRLRVWRYGLPTWSREARVARLAVEAR